VPIDAKRTAKVPCFWIRPDSIVLPAYGGWVGTHAIQPSRQDRVLLCVEGDLIEWKLH
jgi:metallophosphoesterase superfamily enzyme